MDETEHGRVVCAWCGADMGPCLGLAAGAVSHGLCPKCQPIVDAEIEEIRRENTPCP